jgi:NAD(P)H-nitrite reductase large subunit
MKQYVIVGAGAAAAACIEGIRSVDRTGKITVISEEERPFCCRPLISYYLEGKTDLEHMHLHSPAFTREAGCTVCTGRRAVHLDAAAKAVRLDSGGALPYDALCVAAGASPQTPDYPGLEGVHNVFHFNALCDALALEKAVTKSTRVLILGGGLIGLKCAESLQARAGGLTVCIRSGRLLRSILDADGSEKLRAHLEKQGVQFILGDTPARFEGNAAVMGGGQRVEFDALVIASGNRPNTELVKNAGGAVGRGILVDTHMATALPDVYAAGDCAEGWTLTGQTRRVLAIWPNAVQQGYCAGVNMAGGDKIFDRAIPMNSIGLFGLHVMSAGTYTDLVYEEQTATGSKKLFARDGVLTGFILIGDVQRAGIYTALIREKTPLASIDFEAVKREPSLLPFGRAYRAKKLGGAV